LTKSLFTHPMLLLLCFGRAQSRRFRNIVALHPVRCRCSLWWLDDTTCMHFH